MGVSATCSLEVTTNTETGGVMERAYQFVSGICERNLARSYDCRTLQYFFVINGVQPCGNVLLL